jgi:hypothetical protein
MGAIRAVETEPFGTIGVGRVFEWYRDGLITADDEIALLHGSEEFDFRPLSVPLVNIRASLYQAVARGWIDTNVSDRVLEVAQALHYPQRQIIAILRQCERFSFGTEVLREIQRALTTDYVDIKRDDARELLEVVRKRVDDPTDFSPRSSFEFVRSGGFEGLCNIERRIRHTGVDLPLQSIAEHVALHSPEFDELRASSLHRAVCLFFANLVEVRVTEHEVEMERNRFLRDRSLDTSEALDAWLLENALSQNDFRDLIREEALCSRLRSWILGISQFDRGTRYLLDELRKRGTFSDWAKRAAEETAIARNYYELSEYEPFRSQDPATLARLHRRRTGVRIIGDAAAWAEERGFESVVGLEAALRRAAVCHDVRDRIARVDALVTQATDLSFQRAAQEETHGEQG